MKRAFCWLYTHWMLGFVNDKSGPLVKAIDLLESSCKYCLVFRWIMATAGVTMALCGHWIALSLPALAYLLAIGERIWLCDLPAKE